MCVRSKGEKVEKEKKRGGGGGEGGIPMKSAGTSDQVAKTLSLC